MTGQKARKLRARWFWILLVLVGCARQASDSVPPLHTAYRMLDLGENARAIAMLEPLNARDPKNEEVAVLLASAYMGEAGIDIYKVHDSFQDLFFSKPLGQSFLPGGAPSSANPAASDNPFIPPPKPDNQKAPVTPIGRLAEHLDSGLDELRRAVAFLNRFPEVEEKRWPLMDRALELLDPIENDRGLALYRIFVRVIYLKAYLDARVTANGEVGTREWACNIELERLNEALIWMGENLEQAGKDFHFVFPKKTFDLDRTRKEVANLTSELDEVRENPPPGSTSGLESAQSIIRQELECSR